MIKEVPFILKYCFAYFTFKYWYKEYKNYTRNHNNININKYKYKQI